MREKLKYEDVRCFLVSTMAAGAHGRNSKPCEINHQRQVVTKTTKPVRKPALASAYSATSWGGFLDMNFEGKCCGESSQK